jgi:TIR domain
MTNDKVQDKTNPRLRVLLIGASPEVERLKLVLQKHSAVETAVQVLHTHHAWGKVYGAGATVIIDLQAPYDDIDSIAHMVFRMGQERPEIVFAFLGDEEDFATKTGLAPQLVRTRLGHYYRLPRQFELSDVERLVKQCVAWHRTLIDGGRYAARYKYDVAISFAGEQRHYAEELATILRTHNVQVFYDSFEQAELWGKNLFEHLFIVYSEESRYCIVFVSAEYASKMWTVHERRAAQERVLKERAVEYLLPIRVDHTRLPGLPDTVAYLNVDLGIKEIARLFIRKLGVAIGTTPQSD